MVFLEEAMRLYFFFKQKTADEMRISDWSSDVCSSDLLLRPRQRWLRAFRLPRAHLERPTPDSGLEDRAAATSTLGALGRVTVPAKSGNVRNISWQSD